MLDLGHRRRSTRSRCTSWERGRHELGQTREGLEGGWEEGGEKGGRDEGWREEEEVRRGWREGVERGSIGGCGRSIEFSEREEWRREECWIENGPFSHTKLPHFRGLYMYVCM